MAGDNKNPKFKESTDKWSGKYWATEITGATERHKDFLKNAEESIKVYNTKHKLDEQISKCLNCWWSVIQTLIPAYFSSTPQAEVSLRKYAGSTIYQIVSTVLERNVQYELDEKFDFEEVGLSAAIQFLLTGRAVLWARYEADLEDSISKIKGRRIDSGLVDLEGNPLEQDDESEVFENDESGIELQKPIKVKKDERALLEIVQYNDYLESDARVQSDIFWKSRRAFMTRDEVTDMFGKDLAKKLNYNSYPETTNTDKYKDRNIYDGKAELREIHCIDTGKIYWVQANGDKSILESGDPQIKYEGFWPCESINSSLDPDSTIPVSDYVHAKDQIIEVERLTTRLHAVTLAIRTNFAYDATLGVTIEDLLKGDLKGIPIKSWPAYKSRGGLAAGIEWMNIDPYIKALDVLNQARDESLGKLYEMLKCSELMRGTSDPRKTATASRNENAWSSLGLIVRQNQFASFIGKSIGKLGTIIAQQFSPDRILETAAFDDLVSPLIPQQQDPNQPPQDPQVFIQQMSDQVNQILKNKDEMCYRISVSSDTMVALDAKQERADCVDLMQSAGGFFNQMQGLITEYPMLLPFAMGLQKNVMRHYKGGKELEALFMKAMQDVTQAAQQKQAQQAQTPPDPKMMEVQGRMQIAQIEEQGRQALAQAELQKIQAETHLEATKIAQDFIIEQGKLKLQANSIDVDLLKVQATTNIAMANQEIAKEQTRLAAIIDTQKLQIEKQQNNHQALVDAVEAAHKAREHTDNHIANLAQIAATSAPGEAPAKIREGLGKTPIPEKKASKPKMKIHKIITDASGMPIELHSTEIDAPDPRTTKASNQPENKLNG